MPTDPQPESQRCEHCNTEYNGFVLPNLSESALRVGVKSPHWTALEKQLANALLQARSMLDHHLKCGYLPHMSQKEAEDWLGKESQKVTEENRERFEKPLAAYLTRTYNFSSQQDQTAAMAMGKELFEAAERSMAERAAQLEDALRDIERIASKPSVPKRTIKKRAQEALSGSSLVPSAVVNEIHDNIDAWDRERRALSSTPGSQKDKSI